MSAALGAAPAYCQLYCEENVWQLCAHASVAAAERRVLLISNRSRRVAMWGQRAAENPLGAVAWDYHVVLIFRAPRPERDPDGWSVWDLDARDPGPRPALGWLRESFRAGPLPPIYAPRFRLVSCAEYRRHLRSDRRHMRDHEGALAQPEPPWPPIMGEPPSCAPTDEGCNLDRFLDMDDAGFLGELFDLAELERWLNREAHA